MRKQWFWGLHNKDGLENICGPRFIHRFRTDRDRAEWLNGMHRQRKDLLGCDPEVRRIKRRIAAGEVVTFPVEID